MTTTYDLMTTDHFRGAELLLNGVANRGHLDLRFPDAMVAAAQVHATLAVAAAVVDLITLLRSE